MTITIPVELYSTKNGQQIIYSKKKQRLMVIKKLVAKRQESTLNLLLMANKRTWDKMIEGKQFPLKVGFYIYRKTRRRWDWINILQGLQDAMVKANYLPDDNASYLTPYCLGWEVDKDKPRVEICVL